MFTRVEIGGEDVGGGGGGSGGGGGQQIRGQY